MNYATNTRRKESIVSKNNLTLCKADYFETCWCPFNSTQYTSCSYLLRHVISSSNSSHFCVYHTLRSTIECFDSSVVFPSSSSSLSSKINSPSLLYMYVTLSLLIIGLVGNGISMIVLLKKSLRRLCVYKNLTILCALNILYLIAIFVRHTNNYKRDLRNISPSACRLHSFTVTFLGHLCSWQLVSMSIQRVYALLSLQTNRENSWVRTWSLLLIFVVMPTFIFDAQLLFNYGLLKNGHMCTQISTDVNQQFQYVTKFPTNISELSTYQSQQFQRALNFPINSATLSNNISFRYYTKTTTTTTTTTQTGSTTLDKSPVCVLWNICDAFIYAIIPFVITLVCSIIIIVKVCERRHSTIVFGGTCHSHHRVIVAQDHLSILLIAINFLFFFMTSPFNIYLIVGSFHGLCYSSTNVFVILDECLRSLQNGYHASVFLFHCVIGNKFRNSARSLCGTICSKLIDLGIGYKCPESVLVLFSCCNESRRSPTSAQPLTTTTRLSVNENVKRMPIFYRGFEQRPRHNSFPLVTIKRRSTCVSINARKRTRTEMGTPV